MKRTVLILIPAILILLLPPATLRAQKEANYWYFGENAGLDFSNGAPVALLNGAMNKDEGCSSISDGNGNLLFYTSGLKVWNRNHTVMPNGSGLLGHESSSQAALIVPRPGSSSLYYIFTTDAFFYPNGLRYSLVDMSLQGGMGDVTAKNVLLHTPSTEKLTAVKHSNNSDIWLISHAGNSAVFESYLITSAGIGVPVSSTVGTPHSGGGSNNTLNAIGCMKASPDGTKLALTVYNMGLLEIFDFNSSIGTLSNVISLPAIYSNAYGVEFSPDNSKLYFSTDSVIYQVDLLAGSSSAIIGSAIPVGSVVLGPFGDGYLAALQLGPDHKIYGTSFFREYLCVINLPNARGIECNFVEQGVYLGGRHCYAGLPGFVQSWFNAGTQIIDKQETAPFAIQVFPNPFLDELEIVYEGAETLKCELVAVDGRLLYSLTLDGPEHQKLNLSFGLPAGLYLLKAISDKGVSISKLVKLY